MDKELQAQAQFKLEIVPNPPNLNRDLAKLENQIVELVETYLEIQQGLNHIDALYGLLNRIKIRVYNRLRQR